MRYPNRRYGNPTELQFYVGGYGGDVARVARLLRRDERTIRDYLSGAKPTPWWVPEILRLKRMEADERHRQMFGAPRRHGLAVVTDAAQLELRRPREKTPQTITELRRADFGLAAKA